MQNLHTADILNSIANAYLWDEMIAAESLIKAGNDKRPWFNAQK